MNLARHILVATDFGPASERAIDTSMALAKKLDARLSVLHVLEPVCPDAVGVPVPFPVDVLKELRAGAVDRLTTTVESAREHGLVADGVFREGTPWREVISAVKELRIDLVVVGSHGRRGLSHRMLGSVAERIVRSSPVPVLNVHGFWFEDRAQAGQELGAALASFRARSPVVVAISRGGIVVAAEVARTIGAPLEVLLTSPLEAQGVDLGAICEGGMTHFAPGAIQNAIAAEQHEKLLSKARTKLQEDAVKIRGDSWPSDLWRRVVIVVSDSLTEPWRASAAADSIAKTNPDAIVLAAPVASEKALSVLEERFPEIIVLHELRDGAEASVAYRQFREPSARALARLLRASTPCIAHSARPGDAPSRGMPLDREAKTAHGLLENDP